MSAGRIRLVSASAGTGKTHRLVDELETAITRTEVRPEAVIATTFTVKAAAELRERVRSRLLQSGRLDEAHRLGAARMGTVNAICAQLVTDFAFELGISPEVQVLDETAAEEAFGHAISRLVSTSREADDAGAVATNGAAAELVELTERWPGLDWVRDVRAIAAAARANGICPAALRQCAHRSIESLLTYFPDAAEDANHIEQALSKALADFEPASLDSTNKTRDVVTFVHQVRARMQTGRGLSWTEWAKLATADVAVGSRKLYEPVRVAALGHARHPALRDEIVRCVRLVFELAASAIEAYDCFKREWGLMDFVDQEVLALELLSKPHVQEMLRDQVDLVLVDEFQDTNPLQLAIFLALSRIAPLSVWVGDQKQAIYGFRGTDPALMDAAIAAIVETSSDQAYESLEYSWRSRAELVHLTSDIFAPAFARNGIPSERVRLKPAKPIAERPDHMGAVVERWMLNQQKKDEQASAVAAAVRELLADADVRVRDVTTDEERGVQARDIAILCRTGADCERVTRRLESGGIRAVRPRQGLMSTPEARLVLAALRLWVEPAQALAAAEIGRLLVHPDRPDEWLATVINRPGEAYTTEVQVQRIADARERYPLAGPMAAFDAAIEAVGAHEACVRWGRSSQRLANLDALRALVHRYVATCETEGKAATVAGLIAHLRSLADDKKDEQATLSGEDAVTVGTLHSAKGLEWPITVLHEIDSSHKPTAFGVHLVSDQQRFDFVNPLGDRWIRYWPDPYAPLQRGNYSGKTEVHERVRNGAEHADAERRERREALRLLYVGWTRARDRVVLTGRQGKLIGDTLGLLVDDAGTPLISEPLPQVDDSSLVDCKWAGRNVKVKVRSTDGIEPVPRASQADMGYDAAGPRDFLPATLDMSRLPATGTIGDVETIGRRAIILEPVEWAALGSAVHAFMAGDRADIDMLERVAMAQSALERWGVQASMRADAIVAASDAVRKWTAERWPKFAWHREWPVRLLDDEGTELVGYVDLVLMDGDSFVLVDHKCLGGSSEEAVSACAAYAGQLRSYARAIATATGKQATGCFLHLVAHGLLVGVTVT